MSSKYNGFLLSTCLPLIAVAIILAPAAAHAGFEWTPSEKIAVPIKNIAPNIASNIASNNDVEITAPVSIEDITWEEAETFPMEGAETFPVIEGFGNDMPLVLALRQIAPVKYAFSFGRLVNPGTIISWEGGKPWNIILEEVLSPLNIQYKISGNSLILTSYLPSANGTTTKQSEDADSLMTPIIIIDRELETEKNAVSSIYEFKKKI